MPCIDATLPRGRFDRGEQEALVAELTRLIIHWESGTDRPGYDKASWAFVHEVDLIAVGGRARSSDRRQVYRVVASDLAQMFGVGPGDERWGELRFDQR